MYLGTHEDNMRDMAERERSVHSDKQRAATALANVRRTGWKMPEESKKAIRKAMSGAGNPQFGKKGELATCYGRTGDKHPMFGKSHSEEARRKISEASKALWARRKGL